MNRKRTLSIVLVLVVVLVVVLGARHGIDFDFHSFLHQLRFVDLKHILIAILLIYGSYAFRSYRWSIFMRAHQQVGPFTLVGSQFIGFTAVALFGRIADLSRPYLIAQKTRSPLALQVAVYTVERMFDLGAAALIFSSALALMPRDMPHHEIFMKVGIGSLAGTLFLAGFCVVMRISGVATAALARRMAGGISPKFGEALESKLLAFRAGLNAISSLSDFAITATLSLVMWLMIAMAYVQTAHAFTATPSLATVSFSRTMLLLAASIGGSLLQLPVIGWFTQIAATAAAMHGFYGTPVEPATACGALLLIVTFISVIPVGLVFARVQRVSLDDLANRGSEEAAAETGA